jgi:hypothetical protein
MLYFFYQKQYFNITVAVMFINCISIQKLYVHDKQWERHWALIVSWVTYYSKTSYLHSQNVIYIILLIPINFPAI